MVNVLNGESNGDEKDKAWGWKATADWEKATGKRVPRRELRDLDNESSSTHGQSKL